MVGWLTTSCITQLVGLYNIKLGISYIIKIIYHIYCEIS